MIAKIGGKGRLTLPTEARRAVKLTEGQVVEIQIVDDDTLVIRAKHLVDRKQAWVWTDPWLAKLRNSIEDYEAGRFTRHESDESFLASLDEHADAEKH